MFFQDFQAAWGGAAVKLGQALSFLETLPGQTVKGGVALTRSLKAAWVSPTFPFYL